jgi:hypothetical protein
MLLGQGRPQLVHLLRVFGRPYQSGPDRLIECHRLGLDSELPGNLHGRTGPMEQRAVEVEEMKSRHVLEASGA